MDEISIMTESVVPNHGRFIIRKAGELLLMKWGKILRKEKKVGIR